jgi:hypothetical protein
MATSITRGTTTLYPLLLTGLESSQETGNIVHRIINRSTPDVTFGAATLRSGTLTLLVESIGDAEAMRALHLQAGVFTLEEPDLSLVMYYVPSGEIAVEIDDDNRAFWSVAVDFQEVTL